LVLDNRYAQVFPKGLWGVKRRVRGLTKEKKTQEDNFYGLKIRSSVTEKGTGSTWSGGGGAVREW